MVHPTRNLMTMLIISIFLFSTFAQAEGVKVIIENMAPDNGTWQTPFWVGFHDGSFDFYNQSSPASSGLENFAEDGNAEPLMELFTASDAGEIQGIMISGMGIPPLAPGETAEMTFIMDGDDPLNRYFSFASMVLPSNDAFIGNDDPMDHQIFDGSGNFLGASFTIYGTDVEDAGTEVNDELPMNTAFFGQMTPNTGVDENGVVHTHPGYMMPGSGGILDSSLFVNADFTQGGYEMARITIIRSDTPVSGNVSGLWDLDGSPYLLDSDVTVPAGETLTIEPGVVVYSQSWFALLVHGELQAIGTEDDPITFTSAPAGPGEPGWKGVRFENAQGGHLEYCIIENGKVTAGNPFNRGGAVYALNSDITVSNSILMNNQAGYAGGAIYLENSNSDIMSNIIQDNLVGYGTSGYGGGIYVIDSSPTISDNSITGNNVNVFNTFSPANGRGGGIHLNSTTAMVNGNLISYNQVEASGNVTTHSEGGGISVYNGSPHIINNTITMNQARFGSINAADGGGISVYSATPTIENNIIEGNYGGGIYFESSNGANVLYNDFYNDEDLSGNVPVNLGVISTTNYNGDPADMYYNIFEDPMFADPMNDDFTLQSGSPAIDAGNPGSPYDPDGTIADQGAFYFDQGGIPMVEVILTPANPPIMIPASGGSFNFNIEVANNGSETVTFEAWTMVELPNGSMYGPLISPVTITLNSGASINRDRTQNVPSAAPSGNYTYYGYVGVYPNTIWQSNSFEFEKSSTGDGLFVNNWENTGDSFDLPEANSVSATPTEFVLTGAYPNPFNPTTTISYALPEVARVSLIVYDINGRTVANLVNGYREAGVHEVAFDASSLASGVYFYRLTAAQFNAVGKIALIK